MSKKTTGKAAARKKPPGKAAARKKTSGKAAARKKTSGKAAARKKAPGKAAARKTDAAPWGIVDASFKAAAAEIAQIPASIGVELAFCGRSNVGKSSLMNALMGRRKLVRTSSTPGCTRGINFFEARSRDGAVFQMVDLPGYGYAKRSKDERRSWARLIEHYLSEREWLRGAVLLVDARHPPTEHDQQLISFVRQRQDPNAPKLLIVATKIDKLPKSKRKASLHKLQQQLGERIIAASAVTGDGIETLWRTLRKVAYIGDST